MIFHYFRAGPSRMSIIRFSSCLKEAAKHLKLCICHANFNVGSSMQLGELVKKIEQELVEAQCALKGKQLLYENCVATVASLEKSIKEHSNNREGRLKDLEKYIGAIKVQMQAASKDLKVGFIYLFICFTFFYRPISTTILFILLIYKESKNNLGGQFETSWYLFISTNK